MALPTVNTIADGTAVKCPGDKIFPYIQENGDDHHCGDSELIVAFLDMVENHKDDRGEFRTSDCSSPEASECKEEKIVSVLSGGNMDVITMASASSSTD